MEDWIKNLVEKVRKNPEERINLTEVTEQDYDNNEALSQAEVQQGLEPMEQCTCFITDLLAGKISPHCNAKQHGDSSDESE